MNVFKTDREYFEDIVSERIKETIGKAVSIVPGSLLPFMFEPPVSKDAPAQLKFFFRLKDGDETRDLRTSRIEAAGSHELFTKKLSEFRAENKALKTTANVAKTTLNAMTSPLAEMSPKANIPGAINGLASAISNAPNTYKQTMDSVLSFERWQSLCHKDPELAASFAADGLVEYYGKKVLAELIAAKALESIERGDDYVRLTQRT